MKILITGASGFVGSKITMDLLDAGHQVTCCVRNTEYTKKLFPQAKIVFCDFIKDNHQANWSQRLKNIDIVINTVGIFYHPNKKIIWKTHYETPKALFDACVEAKVKKIIHISALGVDKYDVDYAKSKLAADQHLLKLPLVSIILRPSLIYGRGSYGGTSLFRGLAGLPFVLPTPGKGKQQFQPIYLPDLSSGILRLIELPLENSIILNTVSKTKITITEILQTLRNWLALPKAMVFAIPNFIIKLGSFWGNLIPNSTLNSSGYKMLMENNISAEIETNKFIKQIGFEPKDFKKGTFSEPSTVQDRWQAQLYFIKPLLQLSLAFLWLFTAITSAFIYPQAQSFDLLKQVGISPNYQPFFLYGASLFNAILGLALLFNFHVRKICVLQFFLIILYTLIISLKLPYLWLEPFGPIIKNFPILVGIYILYILENQR